MKTTIEVIREAVDRISSGRPNPFDECYADWDAVENALDELASARERIAALEGQVGVLRSAVTRANGFIEHNYDVIEHWNECDQRSENPDDPPDEDCNCQFGLWSEMQAALASTAPTTEGPKETP